MDEKLREKVEKILDDEKMGFAYLYPNDGMPRQEYVFAMTPENMANFIGSHFFDAREIILTDVLDLLILNTYGGFINSCPNQQLCEEVLQHLRPIQMGEKQAEEFPIITREEYYQYGQWEYEQELAKLTMG